MIVGQQKPLEEIWEMVKDRKRLLVLGCNTCVAVCHEGGSKEAGIIASLLRMKATQEGMTMDITEGGIERQCEEEFFAPVHGAIAESDAVLSTACGIGVQFIAAFWKDKPVFPALNTTFLGGVETEGIFSERCQACGSCVLGRTGGICPMSRCAKRVLNGPCGGSVDGRCEINKDTPCAWQLIVDRLKELNQMDRYEELSPIQDWSKDRAGGPRTLEQEDLKQ
ncbi:methylenetetrahydrofolate reductase C-terminal domain-containing protein [Desulfoluna spongiiphila]|uniref:Methylene-tetrahydrofolate reductase C terminal n=1 Tax=Desulfoluna spongiiphila TaxID=419481 RepID=A0A1G5E0D0_9BACT|nr:methylenetetrahydrofolate reductase C-terminal domain-containing protein [Desulfoluna spongiiphila]SCY20230.1 Methylene-tetrahydrofolate reductase C terminal [Desulfoluna spongiiphila]